MGTKHQKMLKAITHNMLIECFLGEERKDSERKSHKPGNDQAEERGPCLASALSSKRWSGVRLIPTVLEYLCIPASDQ